MNDENDDKLDGADTGAHEPDDPATDPGHPTAPGDTASGPTPGGRFGIRRHRTRAEERIAELDASPAALAAEVDAMRARAETAEADAAEMKAQWQRTAADFQNYRRRTEQDRADLVAFASEGLLRKVLPLADDFERALAHAPADGVAAAWVEGMAAIDRKLRMLLDSEGVTPIEALGQPFDPRLHDAIIHEPTTEHPDGTVVKELQRGYELNGRVLRPALVAVADNTTPTAQTSED